MRETEQCGRATTILRLIWRWREEGEGMAVARGKIRGEQKWRAMNGTTN